MSEIEAKVEKLVYGGQGLIHDANKAYLVPFVSPGELVQASFKYRKKGVNWARLDKVVTPGTELREEPVCQHFGICGGCNYQHLKYLSQVKVKEAILQEIYQGKISLGESLISPAPFAYRNKCEFTFGQNEDGELVLGLHPFGKFFEVLDLKECHLLAPEMWEALQQLLTLARESGLGAYHDLSDTGFWSTVTLRHSTSNGELLLLWKVKDPHDSRLQAIVAKLRQTMPKLIGVMAVPTPRGDIHLLAGRNTLSQKIDQVELMYQAENFFQINTYLLPLMMRETLSLAKASGADLLYDLFSGVGALGIYIGHYLPHLKIIAAETDPSASRLASLNAELNQITQFQAHQLDLFQKGWGKLIKATSTKACAIVDPPRAGLTSKTLVEILYLEPTGIIYVSCNPMTQKRDLDKLAEHGYKLKSLKLIDLFPQTYHLESIAFLERASDQF